MTKSQLNSPVIKQKNSELVQRLTNLKDRLPLQNSGRSADLTFIPILLSITAQTFNTVLLFLYTIINFYLILLNLTKFILCWVINLLQTNSKASVMMKLVLFVSEFLLLIAIVLVTTKVIFMPILSMQLFVVNRIVGVNYPQEQISWLLPFGGAEKESYPESMQEDFSEPDKQAVVQNSSMRMQESQILLGLGNKRFSEFKNKNKNVSVIRCGTEPFNETHIRRKVIIVREGMSIENAKLICDL